VSRAGEILQAELPRGYRLLNDRLSIEGPKRNAK
jgi:hypothetical protein